MAKGIDACAGTVCVNSGSYTVAIVGNGLDICYPAEHERLMERIRETGLLLSEYPPGTEPSNYNDSAQKTPAVRKNVRGMNAPITYNATIISTGFSSGIVGFSWPDVLQNAVIRCIALLFQEKHFR